MPCLSGSAQPASHRAPAQPTPVKLHGVLRRIRQALTRQRLAVYPQLPVGARLPTPAALVRGHRPAHPPPVGETVLKVSSRVNRRPLPFWRRKAPETPAPEAQAGGSVSRGLAGPVPDEPLPAWLNQVYDAAQVPRVNLTPPVAPYAAGNDAPSAPPLPGGTSGAQLVDDSALPDWLRAQAGPMPISDARAGVSPAGPMADT